MPQFPEIALKIISRYEYASEANNNGLGSGEGLYLMVDGVYLGADCSASSISESVRARCQTLFNAWKTFLKAN